jgi:hypothetical protein
MKNRTMVISQTGGTGGSIYLVPQTGLPVIYPGRSKELIYDVLQQNVRFAKNPFGPQLLILSRPNHRW